MDDQSKGIFQYKDFQQLRNDYKYSYNLITINPINPITINPILIHIKCNKLLSLQSIQFWSKSNVTSLLK